MHSTCSITGKISALIELFPFFYFKDLFVNLLPVCARFPHTWLLAFITQPVLVLSQIKKLVA